MKNRLHLLSLLLFILMPLLSRAQPGIVWSKVLGSSEGALINDVQPTPDGNLIVLAVAGAADSNVVCTLHGESDVWVFKMDLDGNILWQNCYGGNSGEYGWLVGRILNTADQGYIFMVVTNSTDGDITNNHGYEDVWIVKLDSTGAMQWQRCYGGGGTEAAFSFIASGDGGYIFTADSNSPAGSGDIPFHYGTFLTTDAWVVKIDSAGNIVWNRILGGSNYDMLCTASLLGDTVVLFGHTQSTDYDLYALDVDGQDGWIVMLDSAGNTLSSQVVGTDLYEYFTEGLVTSDKRLIAAGFANNIPVDTGYFHGGNADVWVVKLRSDGSIIWQGLYGGSAAETGVYDCLKEAPFGSGYYVGCLSWSNDGDVSNHHGSFYYDDFWILKIDTSGHLLWQLSIGGSKEETLNSLGLAAGMVFPVGESESTDGDIVDYNGQQDGWGFIVKLDDLNAVSEVSAGEHSLKIFPNPTASHFSMQLPDGFADYPVELQIFTSQGRFLITTCIPENGAPISVNLPAGVYYYEAISSRKQLIGAGDFVIQ